MKDVGNSKQLSTVRCLTKSTQGSSTKNNRRARSPSRRHGTSQQHSPGGKAKTDIGLPQTGTIRKDMVKTPFVQCTLRWRGVSGNAEQGGQPGFMSGRLQCPTPQGQSRRNALLEVLSLGGMQVSQVLMLGALPVAVLERIPTTTPLTVIILVTPFGLVGLSKETTRKSKAVKGLIVGPKPTQSFASGCKVNSVKAIKLSSVGDLASNDLSPRPLEPHFDFSRVGSVKTERAKTVRQEPTPVNRQSNMLQPIQDNGSQG